jgi:hypothetical protein
VEVGDDTSGTIFPVDDAYALTEGDVVDCVDETGEVIAASTARVVETYRLRPVVHRRGRVEEVVGTIEFQVQQFRDCDIPDQTGTADVLMRRP